MSAVRSNIKVLCLLLVLVTCGTATLGFVAFNYDGLQLPPMTWLFLQSLSLYTVYLSFQTLFFERFIACFRIKGNVGFFIVTLDFIGYTGTVVVLVFKEFFNPDINWLDFYNLMSGYVGIVCSVAFPMLGCLPGAALSQGECFGTVGLFPFPFAPLVPAGQFLAS